jgi:LuxR family maltose regulon positive regulatory protein
VFSSCSRPLLAAKLLVPPVRREAVPRSRLTQRLDYARERKLSAVIAPAGWGKTTLLASWARQADQAGSVGWFSIDDGDDEPVRFWTYALSALATVAPELTGEALSALGAPGLDPLDVALTALLNSLAASADRKVLVLDDYHLLTDPAIHESVEFLLGYLPPSLHLVIASRADPSLPLARMRARGSLTEIRVDDLRCTPDEASRLVTAVADVPAGTAGGLAERTEGWPAGLQLAALTLRGSVDPALTSASIRGDQRHILDYFAAEVLTDLDDDQRDLLVRCSVFERLSGSLCDAALETTGSATVLEQLDRADLFVTALGEGWYRCHRLFRDVLRRELDAFGPGQAERLLTRGADWFLAQGRVEEAVAHRLSAGDNAGALELIRRHGRWFLDHGAMAALLRFGELASPGGGADPRLCLSLSFAAGLSGQPDRCLAWLQAAEPLIAPDSESLSGWRSLRAAADSTWSAYVAGDPETALRYARRAVELEDDPMLWGFVVARQALADALLGAGSAAQAAAVLRECWDTPSRKELPVVLALQCAGQYALVLVETGDAQTAQTVCGEAAEAAAAAEAAWGDAAAAAVAAIRLAQARIAAAEDPVAALPELRRAARLAQSWGLANVVVAALTSLAGAQWAAGQREEARESMTRAGEVADSEPTWAFARSRLDDLQTRIGRGSAGVARARGELTEELTDRELAILRALRGPLSSREIGRELYLSINTVKGYSKNLYRKLGVVTRADAVRRGHELGLI